MREPWKARHVLLSVRGGSRPADRQDDRRRGHRGRAEFRRRLRAPGRRQDLREGLRAGAKALQPEPRALADEAHQPREGPQPGPGVRADLLGGGARNHHPQAARDPHRRPARRIRLSEGRGELRRRRHAPVLHGHLPGVPRRVGADGHGLRLRPGREVLPLRAPLRRVLASRIHRFRRHAAVQLQHLLRREHRGLRRRGGRMASRECARARHEARAGRAAPVGDRRLLGGMGADQAEDRPGVPVRADPRAAARSRARAARRRIPDAANQLALPRRRQRLLPARPGKPCAAPRGGAGSAGAARGGRDRPRWRRARAGFAGGRDRFFEAGRARAAVLARVGADDLRRAGSDDPAHRQRVSAARAGRRDHGDRRQDHAASGRSR